MIYPEFLVKDDIIGVTALSEGAGNADNADNAIKEFERSLAQITNQGFRVIETDNTRAQGVVSSSGYVRSEQLLTLIKDPEVKLIISAKGGNFLEQMLPYVDFEELRKHPTWIQGYSDNTGILFPYTVNCDVATIYGPNAGGFQMTKLHDSLLKNIQFWKGVWPKQHSYEKYQQGFVDDSNGYQLNQPVRWETVNGSVNVSGRLIGGCLDVLQYHVGTPYAKMEPFLEKYKEDGFIWYFDIFALRAEDCVHAFWQMRQAGWFRYLKGIVVGRVCFPQTLLEMSYEMALKQSFGEQIPIVFNADIGHVKPQMTMVNGAMAEVVAKNGKGYIKQWMKP